MEEEKENSIENGEKKEKPSLVEKVDFIFNTLQEIKDKKDVKKLKLLRKAKVSKGRIKRGWVGILFLNENRVISGQKVKLEGGTYKTKDGNYHVTNGKELLFWEGKYPILIQRYDKLNPTNILLKEGEKNEVYGQDLIMLRIKKDIIKEKKKFNLGFLYIILILVAGYFLLKSLFPNLFGG